MGHQLPSLVATKVGVLDVFDLMRGKLGMPRRSKVDFPWLNRKFVWYTTSRALPSVKGRARVTYIFQIVELRGVHNIWSTGRIYRSDLLNLAVILH